ncbi:MAG: OmpA family protein [Bacteroidia bacterium]
MKKALVLVLLIASSLSFSQTFTLNDTQFKVGSYFHATNLMFELGRATLKQESFSLLDSIVTFLNTYPSLKLEIDVHSDSRTKTTTCGGNLTMSRAKSIVDYLIAKKIDQDRLIPKGYGALKPLITEAEISKLKTKEEKEAAYQKNRRVEFKIIAI